MFKLDDKSPLLVLHFDTGEHTIALDTFVETADAARAMIQALAKECFGPFIEVELHVLPPEEGSFLTVLRAIIVKGGIAVGGLIAAGAGTVTILDFPYIKSYIEARTGKTYAQMGAEHGSSGRAAMSEGQAEALLISAAESLLSATPSDIQTICDILPDDVVQARADFYEACYADRDIKGVGFSREDDFPILRNSFLSYSQPGQKKRDDTDLPQWDVAIDYVQVTSPQWDLNDQKTRQWKGKDSDNKSCLFVIEDEQFWLRVHTRDLHAEVLDRLKVQWAYKTEKNKITARRVLKVLKFNGVELSKPLKADALDAILGRYRLLERPKDQLGFEW
ncbi:hypothetical protein [Ketogulonicigenium robustum]|uniref:hypothetical protein n=1 Tax=Ketogulonicigenium robustum TaxID=92947 RepID=UPI000A26AB0B|nr:hypothetical protein [Ketogulonicigenium robustum]